MNHLPDRMRNFDTNFASQEVLEEREEEIASSMQPISEASSNNLMHTPESQQQSDPPNSIQRSKG